MRKTTIAFSMLAIALIANPLDAQEQRANKGGLFGYSMNDAPTSMINRNNLANNPLGLQSFGEDQNDLTLQTFGEEAPLCNGMFILLAAGLGYVMSKRNTTKLYKNRKENK